MTSVAANGELAAAAYLGIIINWVVVPTYPLRDRLSQLADVTSELLTHDTTPLSDKGPR